MAERMTTADLELALARLAAEVEYPPVPAIVPAVTARLVAERQLRRRPPFAGLALWPRRRVLLLAVAGVLLLAGTAVAARLAIGAIEIRVLPTPSERPTTIPSTVALGPRVSLAEARRTVGFGIALPPGLGQPDEVHIARSLFGSRVVILAWRPDAMHPKIEGTQWGSILMELPGGLGPLAYKDVGPNVLVEPVRFGGHGGFWISGPHDLAVLTPQGEQSTRVSGNVLLWTRGGTTLRLETALPKAKAIALAETAQG
jgi:hypothetical protein